MTLASGPSGPAARLAFLPVLNTAASDVDASGLPPGSAPFFSRPSVCFLSFIGLARLRLFLSIFDFGTRLPREIRRFVRLSPPRLGFVDRLVVASVQEQWLSGSLLRPAPLGFHGAASSLNVKFV